MQFEQSCGDPAGVLTSGQHLKQVAAIAGTHAQDPHRPLALVEELLNMFLDPAQAP